MSKLQDLINRLCPNGVPFKSLDELAILSRGKVYSKDFLRDNPGTFPVYSSQTANDGILGRIDSYDYEGEYLTWTTDGAYAGTIFYRNGKFSITNVCGLIKLKSKAVKLKFLYYWLSIEAPKHVYSGMGNPKLMSNQISAISVPVPPIEIQEEIVKILDRFAEYAAELQAELQARKEQYEYYRNLLLSFNPSASDDEPTLTTWGGHSYKIAWKPMGEVCKNLDKMRKPITASKRKAGSYPYYGASGIVDYVDSYIFDGDFLLISEDGANLLARSTAIAFPISGKNWVNNHAHVLKFENLFTQKFVQYYINMIDVSKYVSGGAQPKLNQENLNSILIPIPPLELQEKIVAILDRFETLVNDLTQGLPAEIAAVREQYEYYRNKLLTFKQLA